ncbi:hypothetical protein [Corynebacterium anserum]|uniref:Uncharacterized protein n=1 Tax=Corynebacterium anserum TaxID=2684406 RepID=A0A7G7YLG3_9CORY|nr:hypothetical protein [Corynebacterium anserum]QNH95333.1 hypothetical protein GP473_00190 [Corynebacterium anserum]
MTHTNKGNSTSSSDAERRALNALRKANPVIDESLNSADIARRDAVLAKIFATSSTDSDVSVTSSRNNGAETETPQTPSSISALEEARIRRNKRKENRLHTQNKWRYQPKTYWLGLGSAAAAIILIAGALAVPTLLPESTTPSATASEILTQAGNAAAQRTNIVDTKSQNSQYQHRVDTDKSGQVVTSLRVTTEGKVSTKTTTSTQPGVQLNSKLKDLATRYSRWNGTELGDIEEYKYQENSSEAQPLATDARLIIKKLTLPGVDSDVRKQLFAQLANLPGNEVATKAAVTAMSNDKVVTIDRPQDNLRVSLLPTTGEVISVDNLYADGITTTIDAIGILGCTSVVGLEGPEEISLACADQNNVLTNLVWDQWNSPMATATATAWVNDCDPTCASSRTKPYPVRVKISDKENCGYNLDVYSRLEVTYTGEEIPKYEKRTEVHSIGCTE